MGSALVITTNLPIPKSPESMLMDVGASFAGASTLKMIKLCKAAGLCDLWTFCSESDDDFYEMVETLGLDAKTTHKFDEQWFEPSAGLEAVREFRAYLMEHPDCISDSAGIIDDLNAYEADLLLAESVGAKWHFSLLM